MDSREIQNYVDSVRRTAALKQRLKSVLPVLSLFVIILVFWWLKLTGITMAGEAFCGIDEHVHTEECMTRTLICMEETAAETVVQEDAILQENLVGEGAQTDAAEPETADESEADVDSEVSPDGPDEAETPADTEPAADSEPPVESEPPAEPEPTDVPETELSTEPELPAEPESELPAEQEPELSVPAAHEHTDDCYQTVYLCDVQEHIHEVTCYSNISMDLETSADWEATIPELTPDAWAENIVAVAASQLGYTESEMNFVIDEDGVRRGYNRYGEWYGNPYGEWSTMFTSFCLRYAGISDLPVSSGADALRIQWESGQRYMAAADYKPIPGDVVFLDKNGNGTPEVTGIVTAVTDSEITVIEGDLDNRVAETAYQIADEQITGYGLTTPDSLLALAAEQKSGTVLANILNYHTGLSLAGNSFILYTQGTDGNYYAIDGNARAVQIYVDDMGRITSDTEDTDSLFWRFESANKYDNQRAFYIQNVSSGMYLHPYYENSSRHGAILSGRWESALYPNGSGVRIRGARQNAYAYLSNNASFTEINNANRSSTMYLGQPPAKTTVWLDGTCGEVRSLAGSPDRSFAVTQGDIFTLPTEWQSPDKYSYKVQGWFDVKNKQYYLPGAEVVVTEPLVFYPDWVAETYDIGEFNAKTADTVSTDGHITTHVFDYNFLFNLHSANVTVNADSSGHSESWNLVQSGNVAFQGAETLDFVMTDNEGSGRISKPGNLNSGNTYTGNNGGPYSNLYNERIAEALFSTENTYDPVTGTGIIGKQYLGTGDHLFQFGSDPDSEYYGYYYFDSNLNGISYSQRDQRFYVYEYLQRTTDSGTDKTGDFLPLNSPYANTNGHAVETYSHNGLNNEYTGTTHYQYDIFRDNDYAAANLWFGMSMETRFYLPDDPGTAGGNKDVYGNDMHFSFSGDDDVWVLVDGHVVLDLGGIHRSLTGDINFSTGKVTVDGKTSNLPASITAGEHKLTIYYLERGGGQSNCLIRFNLAPRYSLTLQKEDVLTRELLNGAVFSVYTDESCKTPAQLWVSEDSYNNNDPASNEFTIIDGKTHMWGLGAGKTYYIKETKPPDNPDYHPDNENSLVNGIICLTLDKSGNASYSVKISMGKDQNGEDVMISPGFTVHGYRIDEETQEAYIVATNAPKWVQEVTSIQALKVWEDSVDHSGDSVTVYLTVKDPEDGTVRRIREVELSEANNWTWIWENMPKYWDDNDKSKPVEYGVEEAYFSGYTPSIEQVTGSKLTVTSVSWDTATSFESGETYILSTKGGYLSSQSSSALTVMYVDEETAKSSPLAQWTASVSNKKVTLTNKEGQILSLNNEDYNRYFYVTTSKTNYQGFTTKKQGDGLWLYVNASSRDYYLGNINHNGHGLATTSSSNDYLFTLQALKETSKTIELKGESNFKITNTPLENETSVTVKKVWDTGPYTNVDYQQLQVTVKLYADGKDTGRTVTLALRNNWTDTFLGLPYTREDGTPVEYTVKENKISDNWAVTYGDIVKSDTGGKDAKPIYHTTVTNTYRYSGPVLPSTGGLGPLPWILCGFSMMAGSLVYGYIWRRKCERRYSKG